MSVESARSLAVGVYNTRLSPRTERQKGGNYSWMYAWCFREGSLRPLQNIDDCIARVELWAKGNTQKRTNESRKGVKKRFPTISSEWDMQNMPQRSGYVTSFKNLTEAPLARDNRSRKITRHPCQPESATHCQAIIGPGEEQEQVTRVRSAPLAHYIVLLQNKYFKYNIVQCWTACITYLPRTSIETKSLDLLYFSWIVIFYAISVLMTSQFHI